MTRIGASTASSPRSPVDESGGGLTPTQQTSAAGAGGTCSSGVAVSAGSDRPAPLAGTIAPRRTIDVGALRDELVKWEGSKPFMYLCAAGHVTTGIGNKLGSAQEAASLPWQHRATGLPATPAEIRAAFARIAAMTSEFRGGDSAAPNPFGARHYEKASDLVLPPSAANELAVERLSTEFLPGLRGLFPGFDAYPQPAQRALVDMAYTLGVKGLRTKFPRLVEACRRGNFAQAAAHSHRKVKANVQREGDARNVATRDLFLEAARLTASVGTLPWEVRP